jgi:apolipoprotein N-acyltransferase
MHVLQRYAAWLSFPVGALLSLAFAPFDLWPLAVLCPAFLFLIWQGAAPKRAAKLGFLFTAGTYVAGTYWLYNSVYVIGQAPLPVAIFLMLGLAAIMGGYMAIVAYVQAKWLPERGFARYLLALPAILVLLEWIRGWLFSGFPWLALGYTAIDTPLAGIAPLFGAYGASWVYALMAGAVAALTIELTSPVADRKQLLIAGAIIAVPWMLAFPLWKHEWTQPAGNPITVAIVQGAVPQEMKWSSEQRDATLKLYRNLTVPHWGTDLIVWPESTLPAWAEQLTDYLSNMWQEAQARRSHLVIGQIHVDERDGRPYNSVLSMSDTVQWYNKHHLVPFGEYFPVPGFVREWMRLMSLPNSDFASGARNQPLLQAAGQKIATTICYEDAYATTQLASLKDATMLVNVTNDAWFGDSTARHQHLQIARMRAAEAGRPLVRAANDGISAIIDAQGTITDQLPSFQSAVLKGEVQPRTGLTLFARVGNWPVVIGACLALLMAVLIRKRRTKPNSLNA